MRWLPVDKKQSCDRGIAIYSYRSKEDYHLSLVIGDFVILDEIFENKWYYGRLESTGQKGIFPCSYILPLQREQEYPKISQTICEWMTSITKLYIYGDDKESKYVEMCKIVESLVQEKMNLDSGIRGEFQIKECKDYVSRLIDRGNMELQLDMQLRNSDFSPINPLDWYCASLYYEHKEVSKALDHRQMQSHSSKEMCSILIEFQDINLSTNSFPPETDLIVSFSLYAVGDRPRLFSEVAMCNGTVANNWNPATRDRRPRILFTDLTRKTLDSENVALVIQVMRLGAMDLKRSGGQQLKGVGAMKRPVAVGKVRDLLKLKTHENQPIQISLQAVGSSANTNKNEQFLDTVVYQMLKPDSVSSSEVYSMNVGLRIMNLSYNAIREDPVYRPCIVARRLVIVDELKTSQKRNSMYVQLISAEFFEKWDLKVTKEKNIEVAVMLVNSKGEFLSLHPGGATDPQANPVSRYTTTVYHHKNAPRWGELIKINIPDNVRSSHLRFHFIHRAKDKNNLIAFSFLPLQQSDGSMLRNGEHRLYIYKVTDSRKLDEFSVEQAYLRLPYSEEQPGSKGQNMPSYLSACVKDRFVVEVTLSSTVLTNNVNVFGILKWNEHLSKLTTYLGALQDMLNANDVFEIFKFFPQLFNVFFEILCNTTNSKFAPYQIPVFRTILRIISHAQRSEHYSQTINRYLESFENERAYYALVTLMSTRLQEYNDCDKPPSELEDEVKTMLKCAEYLFKLVVRSKRQDSLCSKGNCTVQFEEILNGFFDQIHKLMVRDSSANRLVVQLEATKVFPKIINILINNYSVSQLIARSHDLLHVPVLQILANKIWKGQLMIGLTSGTEFENENFRSAMIKSLIDEVRKLLNDCMTEIMNPQKSQKPSEILKAHNCSGTLEALDNIIRLLEKLTEKAGGSHSIIDDVNVLLDLDCGILRPVSQLCSVLENVFPNDSTLEMAKMRSTAAATMISLLQLMQDSHWERIIQTYAQYRISAGDDIEVRMSLIDLEDLTCELLDLIKSLCNFNVFSLSAKSGCTWTDLMILESRVCLDILHRLHKQVLSTYFFQPLNKPVLDRFFDAIIAFVRQDCLQWHNFSVWQRERYEEKRGFIMTAGYDWRREATNLMLDVWNEVEPNRIMFVPDRVEPFLVMSFVNEEHVRRVAISMIFDLMLAEDNNRSKTAPRTPQPRALCPRTTEMVITSIDRNLNSLDQWYKADFHRIMNFRCREQQRFQTTAAKQLIDDFVEQMHLLIEYNTFIHDENADNRKMAIFNLLKFYEKIKRDVMIVRYLHKLTCMNMRSGDYTEAANTLLLMKKHLDWSDEILGPNLEFPEYTECTTHALLKERLCQEIIELFVKDRMWELAIEQAEDLIKYYTNIKVDFHRTSDMLKRISDYYKEIVKSDRNDIEPCYYVIEFFGEGLPSFIANKSFIYRARFGKRLYDILQMLETQFPMAKRVGKRPDSSDKNQYYKVTAVKPVCKPPEHWTGKEIAQNTYWFYRFNGTNVFEMRTPKANENDMTRLWIEVVTMETQEIFPSVLRMVPIKLPIKMVEKNPLENASETMQEKTQQLRLLLQHTPDHQTVQGIESIVRGILMAFVSGGYENYAGFFSDEIGREEWVTNELISQLCTDIQNQLDVVQRALNVLRKHTSNPALFEQLLKSLTELVLYIKLNFGFEVNLLSEFVTSESKDNFARKGTKVFLKRQNGESGRSMSISSTNPRDSFTDGSGGSTFGSTSTITENPLEDRSLSICSEQNPIPPPTPPRPITMFQSSNADTPPLPRRERHSVTVNHYNVLPPPPPPPPHRYEQPSISEEDDLPPIPPRAEPRRP